MNYHIGVSQVYAGYINVLPSLGWQAGCLVCHDELAEVKYPVFFFLRRMEELPPALWTNYKFLQAAFEHQSSPAGWCNWIIGAIKVEVWLVVVLVGLVWLNHIILIREFLFETCSPFFTSILYAPTIHTICKLFKRSTSSFQSPWLMGCPFLKVTGSTKKVFSAMSSQPWRIRRLQAPGRSGFFRRGRWWLTSTPWSTRSSYAEATTWIGSSHTTVAEQLGPVPHHWTEAGSSYGPRSPPKLRKSLSLGSQAEPTWRNNLLYNYSQGMSYQTEWSLSS